MPDIYTVFDTGDLPRIDFSCFYKDKPFYPPWHALTKRYVLGSYLESKHSIHYAMAFRVPSGELTIIKVE